MYTLWLGYSGLAISYTEVVAVLIYGAPLDRMLLRSYGSVPPGVQAVVLTAGGEYLPARWNPHQIRQRWAFWRNLSYYQALEQLRPLAL